MDDDAAASRQVPHYAIAGNRITTFGVAHDHAFSAGDDQACGVVIHRNQCGNLSNFRKQPDKWIAVTWEKDVAREFFCQIQTDTRNKPGVLAEVAATIGDCGSNIEQVEVLGRHEDCSVISFLLQVSNRVHLAKIMRKVRNMPNVIRVSRDCA